MLIDDTLCLMGSLWFEPLLAVDLLEQPDGVRNVISDILYGLSETFYIRPGAFQRELALSLTNISQKLEPVIACSVHIHAHKPVGHEMAQLVISQQLVANAV
jgi:hypothetical protein